jgi:hypothetical protein
MSSCLVCLKDTEGGPCVPRLDGKLFGRRLPLCRDHEDAWLMSWEQRRTEEISSHMLDSPTAPRPPDRALYIIRWSAAFMDWLNRVVAERRVAALRPATGR